jgi:hypothetical protein
MKLLKRHEKNYAKCKAGHCLEQVQEETYFSAKLDFERPVEGKTRSMVILHHGDYQLVMEPSEALKLAVQLIQASQEVTSFREEMLKKHGSQS